jgi:hypothetical protein
VRTVDAMLELLARGDESQVAYLIYDGEWLTAEERATPLRLLLALRPPPGDQSFSIIERHVAGDYELLILDLPWQRVPDERGTGYHPLLITRVPEVRIIGFVLPWNELTDRLPSGAGDLGTLSATWIIWTMKAQKAH